MYTTALRPRHAPTILSRDKSTPDRVAWTIDCEKLLAAD